MRNLIFWGRFILIKWGFACVSYGTTNFRPNNLKSHLMICLYQKVSSLIFNFKEISFLSAVLSCLFSHFLQGFLFQLFKSANFEGHLMPGTDCATFFWSSHFWRSAKFAADLFTFLQILQMMHFVSHFPTYLSQIFYLCSA